MKRAVIIGKDVSKGARSPILWNAAFNALNIDAEMTAVDIEHESDAIEFLDSETSKPDFIGGAVAAPLKEVVANYFADDSGSFIEPKNCFFNSEGRFTAANTDTLALLESISSVKKDLDIQRVCILGTGGVSKSLCYQLSNQNKNFDVDVYGRNQEISGLFTDFGMNFKDYGSLNLDIGSYDVLINCTSIGKDGNNEDSILSTSQLSLINKEALLFDVNYINSPSKLLRDASSLSLNCIDGSRMNLMQAVIGFCLANDLVGKEDVVHQHMLEAIKEI